MKLEDLPRIAKGLSTFGSEQREGCVVKNLDKGVFGKFINLEFQRCISDDELRGQVHPEIRRQEHKPKGRRPWVWTE